MSYYGISVVITILITSFVAFYLLYKAKELNLGILISITVGSIVLGFSFSPAFKLILGLLSESISINRKLALILSLVVVLFIFLLFICVLSFIISIAIPKRFSSIDCGIYIDKFFGGFKNTSKEIYRKLATTAGSIVALLKNTVRNTYNLKNKLKKPVDTKQIIDTMGIEKSENGTSPQVASDVFANILAHMEPQGVQALESTESADVYEEIEAAETIAAAMESDIDNVDNGLDEASAAELSDLVEAEMPITYTIENDTAEASDDESYSSSADMYTDEAETEISEESETEQAEVEVFEDDEADQAEAEENVQEDYIEDNQLLDNNDMEFINIEDNKAMQSEASEEFEVSAQTLVVKAFEAKDIGRKDAAIEYYIQALEHEPDKEMIFWIVLDVCTLYKQLGLSELAQSILEGIFRQFGSAIKPEIKEEILKNLK